MTGKPFIIWTLQRTGGSNFTRNLAALSAFDKALHEPFNYSRLYGDVARSYERTRNRSKLRESIGGILDKRVLIKHCVEFRALGFSRILLDESVKHSYENIFLYRESAFDRLMSLHYAMSTGVWGRKTGSSLCVVDAGQLRRVNAPMMVAHELKCRYVLKKLWVDCRGLTDDPLAVSYESIYRAVDRASAITTLKAILERVGISQNDDEATYERLVQSGDQNTRGLYGDVRGADRLRALMGLLPRFELA